MRGGAIGAANLAVRFACELGALAALVVGGIALVRGVAGVALGLLAAFVAALTWGRWIAPRAARRLADPLRFALELLVFGLAAGSLAASGHTVVGALFAAVALTTAVLARAWPEPIAAPR